MSGAPSGLVVVDKPGGLTSHDVVARARRALGTRKVGHAGTLDPMATGVLVLGEDADQQASAQALESARGMIRSEVGKQLGMRHVPTLAFVPDALPESARHLDEVLAKARESDERVAAAAEGKTYAGDPDPYKQPRAAQDDDEDDEQA